MLKEEDLVREAVRGDQQAFARLYEEYFDRIYRYLYLKVGDRAEAEDMAQQVFLHAFRSIGTFKWQGTPFTAWLYRIAHNQVVDYLRKKTKRPMSVTLDDTVASSAKDPQHMAELSVSIEEVSRAMRQLTEAQREVLSLRFAGGLSIEEVASAMGKKPGAIKALQHAGIISLRRLLVVRE